MFLFGLCHSQCLSFCAQAKETGEFKYNFWYVYLLILITCKASSTSDTERSTTETSDSSSDEAEFINEVDRYLSTRRIKDVSDPLRWWVENRGAYPCLSRMAKDYLTIPGTSHSFGSVSLLKGLDSFFSCCGTCFQQGTLADISYS
jgi:hypothetical protein